MGTTERRVRERRRRQQEILEAARQVLLARGLEAATMDEVAERAELSKGALYLYFTSKDELVTALVLAPLDDLVNRFEEELDRTTDGASCVGCMLRAQASSMREHCDVFRLVMGTRCAQVARGAQSATHSTLMHARRRRLLELYAGAVTRGQRDGSIRRDLRPEVVAIQLWASLLGLRVLAAQDGTFDHSLEDIADDLVDLFDSALATRRSVAVSSTRRAPPARQARRRQT
jgi:AcrR family transcriptional regulator